MLPINWLKKQFRVCTRNLRINLESLEKRPSFLLTLAQKILNLIRVNEINGVALGRLLDTFSLNYSEPQQNQVIQKSLTMVFVSTRKDFRVLPLSITGGFFSTSNFREVTATVIVPDLQVLECSIILKDLMMQHPVDVIPESSIVSDNYIQILRKKFGSSYGWVLQQVLKTKFSSDSTSDFVLIIDSDTILLRNRNWVLEDGRQLLTPSWEFNYSYYKFLNISGDYPLNPKFTFVSHHMLTQPIYFKKALLKMGWNSLDDVINALISFDAEGSLSPFCIEYELYGQYMYHYESKECFVEKWGNTSIPAELLLEASSFDFIQKKYGGTLASVSSHSYLTVAGND